MVETLNFYMDESGTRHPDSSVGRKPVHNHDWFAFGGVLVNSKDERYARELHSIFCGTWGITYPLHSTEIRGKTGNFAWLESLEDNEQKRFYEELYVLMRDAPLVGLSCVIDRPGYNLRYEERYRGNRWILCKTAFNIAVERAVKRAMSQGLKLSIYVEKCNKPEDRMVRLYMQELKTVGLPFNPATSGKYSPLGATEFGLSLYDFKIKEKSSPLIQMADLYLWPMCMGGYPRKNRTHARLLQDGKLIECHLAAEEVNACGTKYSCFELSGKGP